MSLPTPTLNPRWLVYCKRSALKLVMTSRRAHQSDSESSLARWRDLTPTTWCKSTKQSMADASAPACVESEWRFTHICCATLSVFCRLFWQFIHDESVGKFYSHVFFIFRRQFFYDAVPVVFTEASLSLAKKLITDKTVQGFEADVWLTELAFIPRPTPAMLAVVKVRELEFIRFFCRGSFLSQKCCLQNC